MTRRGGSASGHAPGVPMRSLAQRPPEPTQASCHLATTCDPAAAYLVCVKLCAKPSHAILFSCLCRHVPLCGGVNARWWMRFTVEQIAKRQSRGDGAKPLAGSLSADGPVSPREGRSGLVRDTGNGLGLGWSSEGKGVVGRLRGGPEGVEAQGVAATWERRIIFRHHRKALQRQL